MRRVIAVAVGLFLSGCAGGDQFEILAVLDVGLNPHQIAFTADGATAYVAAAGSDQVTEVDVGVLRVRRHIPIADTPLGVAVLPGNGGLAVSRFGADRVARVRPGDRRRAAGNRGRAVPPRAHSGPTVSRVRRRGR